MTTTIIHSFKRALASLLLLTGALLGYPVQAQSAADIDSGTLKFVLSPEPPFLLTAINTALQMGMVTSKVMEGLLYLDNELKPQPLLAQAWDISPDGLTYTFKLRPNVKWHDGQPFTSADVSYTILEVLKKVHPRGRSAFAKVTAVETPDPLTAVIKLSQPAPPMLTALASSYESPMVPKHLFAGTDPSANPYISKPVGTGPFVFKEWKKGDYILLEKNADYWQAGKPSLQRIVFRIISDASARAASFETGEGHIGGLSPVPLTDMPRIAKNPALSIETRGYAYMSPYMLMEVNLRKPPLNDVRVRQAIAHAIDRARMTQVVWLGYGQPAVSPIPSQVTTFHSTDLPKYEFNIDKAKKLLDDAGLKPGANGMRFKITHDFIPFGSEYQRTGEFIKQQLNRVGIDVELRSQDLPSFLRRAYTEYDFDTTSLYYGAFADPTQGVQRLYWSKAIQKGVVFTNNTGYNSPEMDRLLEGAQGENDPVKRKALYLDMQRLAMTDLPVIPLMETRFLTISSSKLKNHTVSADGIIGGNFADAYFEK
ncbi:MAG: ABC transporter substrate-binding protein [Candidatus Methylopumilus sp.]|nr:ABC transporter substrate-binding protein [Candidatus Methylopumilus sp.]